MLQRDATPPKVTITGIAVRNKWLHADSLLAHKTIELPYDQNALTITYSTLVYQNTYDVFYKLDGLDKEWIATKSSEVVYSYLPPGTYTFKIQALDADNVLGKNITSINIVVLAPFWKTWWFYSLLSLFIIAFLYWLDKERMKRKAGGANYAQQYFGQPARRNK